MSPVPVSPRRVFGVDFSAAQDAGDHIWVCRAHPGVEGIRIESVDPISELPGGARGRDAALAALVTKVTEAPRSAWGFDFPFALPAGVFAAMAPGVSGHAAQLDVVAACGDAEGLRERCGAIQKGQERAQGEGEARRRTDREAETPFSPYNLRVYKQTFHGMVDVLRPLRRRAEVALLPFDALPGATGERGAPPGSQRGTRALPGATDGRPLPSNRPASPRAPHIYVMEVCPASLLAALGLQSTGYKGAHSDHEARREAILQHLVTRGLVRPAPRALRRRIVEQSAGDAIDAVLAAVAAWRGYREHDHTALRADADYGREGFVYT